MQNGQLIRQLRLLKNLSIEEMAHKTKCTAQYIGYIERNNKICSDDKLKIIAKVLEVDVEWITVSSNNSSFQFEWELIVQFLRNRTKSVSLKEKGSKTQIPDAKIVPVETPKHYSTAIKNIEVTNSTQHKELTYPSVNEYDKMDNTTPINFINELQEIKWAIIQLTKKIENNTDSTLQQTG